MNRVRGMIVCAGVTLGLASGLAIAVPPVLEKAPANAMLVFAVPSAQKLDKGFQSLTTSAEIPFPLPGVEEMLAMGGIGDGLDVTKGFAGIVMAPPAGTELGDAEQMRGRTVMLLPITNYAAFLANFEAKPGEAGAIDSVNTGDETLFTRDLGDGYLVMSSNKDLVTNYKGGNPTVKADMGKLGERIADTADIVVLVNMDIARPFIEQGAKAAQERMADQMSMMGVDGGDGGDSPMMKWVSESIINDAKTIVGGMKSGGLGATFEMAANFKEGSPMASAFQAAGNAGSLLAKLPTTQYLLAGAIDTSSPGIKKMLRDMTAKMKESAPADAPQLLGGSLADADGQSFVIGMNPTMMMGGGVLTNTVNFTSSKEPAKVIASVKSEMESLHGKTYEGMTYDASYKNGAAKVGETAVDVWQVKMQAEGGDGMQSQVTTMIFGPQGGPGGYLVEVPGGTMRTFAKNSALMSAAMKSAASGDGLASETLIKQVGGQLPSGRIAEMYIGSRNIVDMLVPMAAMLGVQVDPDAIPAQLPPIGLALAGEGGTAHLSVFLPAPVLKTVWVVGEGLAPQLEGMGGFGDMGDEPAADEPTGQPRF